MDWWIDCIAADIWLILQNIADCASWTAYKLSKFLVRVTIFFTPLHHSASQIFGEGGSQQEGWNLIRLAKFGKICHDIWLGQTVWSVQSYMQSAVGVFTVLIFDPFLISFLISFFRKMGWKMEPEMRWKMTEKHPFFKNGHCVCFCYSFMCSGLC